MQNHLTGRLARRLTTMLVLVVALAAQATAPPASTAGGFLCWELVNGAGQCIIECCDNFGNCYEMPC